MAGEHPRGIFPPPLDLKELLPTNGNGIFLKLTAKKRRILKGTTPRAGHTPWSFTVHK